jgi:hypothetical protein
MIDHSLFNQTSHHFFFFFFRLAATFFDKLPYNQMVSPDLIERVSKTKKMTTYMLILTCFWF